MTTPLWVLAWSEILLVLVMLASMLWRSVMLGLAGRRARDSRARSLDAIAQAVAEGDDAQAVAVEVLKRASRSARMSAVFEIASVVDGQARAVVRRVADILEISRDARELLASRRAWKRALGARLLMALGEPPILMLLDDDDIEVQQVAIAWVAELPEAGALERLAALAGSQQPLLRFVAQDALLRIGSAAGPAVAERIEHIAAHPKSRPAELVALLEVAAGLGEPMAEAQIVAQLVHSSALIRASAVRALAGLGGQAVERAVTDAIADDDARVRGEAAHALGVLGAWRSGPPVRGLLDDSDRTVRRQAAIALGRMGPVGRILLREAAKDGNDGARLAEQVLELNTVSSQGAP